MRSPLKNTDIDNLERLLSLPGYPKEAFGFAELAGFLFAISCSPEPIDSDEWWPLVSAGDNLKCSAKQAAELKALALRFADQIAFQAATSAADLPSRIALASEPLDNFTPYGQFGGWSCGYGKGHRYLEHIWQHYLPSEMDEELGACMLVLTFFSSRELASAFCKKLESGQSVAEMAASIITLVPGAMASYASIGQQLRKQAQLRAANSEQFTRQFRQGRNEPCRCGSGKKYKRCCGIVH